MIHGRQETPDLDETLWTVDGEAAWFPIRYSVRDIARVLEDTGTWRRDAIEIAANRRRRFVRDCSSDTERPSGFDPDFPWFECDEGAPGAVEMWRVGE